MVIINVDEDPNNADWCKINGSFPDTIEEFRRELFFIAMSVDEFKSLPAYRANLNRIPYLRDL